MTEATEKKPKKFRRWRWRTALALLLTPVVLVLVVFAALQTPWVKGIITSTVSGMVGPMIGQEMEISGLRGTIPFHVTLDRFALADAEGEWLTVEHVQLAWSWRALLGGRIVVEDLTVERVALPRIGAFPELEKEPEPFSLPQIPELPGWLEVKHLHAARIEIGKAIIQEDAAFSLHGALIQTRGQQRSTLDLDLVRLDADTAVVGVHIALSGTAIAVDVHAHDESILPGLLNLDGPAEFSLRGDAPPGDWHGMLSASLGSESVLDGHLGLRIGDEVNATARLTLNAAHPLVPEAVAEQLGERVDLVMAVRLEDSGRLQLDDVTATGSYARVAVSGLLDLPGDAVDLRVEVHHDDLGPLVGLEPDAGPQPVDAILLIQGSPAELAIDIDASWDDSPLAKGAVTVGLEGGFALGSDLRVFLPALLLPSAEAADLISEGISITADIPSLSGERIRIAALNVTGIEGLRLHGDADLDFTTGDGRADFVLAIAALEELAFLLGLDIAGGLTTTIEADGAGDGMTIVASVTGESLRFAEYSLDSLQLALNSSVEGWSNGEPRMITASWEGGVDGLVLAPYPGTMIRTSGMIDAPTLDEINLTHLTLTDGVLHIEALGQYLPSSTSGTLELTALADSFAPYGELMGTDLDGTANLQLRARLDEGGESGEAELDAQLTQLAGLPEPAQGLVGTSLTAQARAALADGLATLHALTVQAAHVSASGTGSYGLESGEVAADLTMNLPDLSAAHATLGPDASGAINLDAQARGTTEALAVDARLRGTNVGASGAHADALSLDATVTGLPSTPRGNLTLVAVERGQQLEAEAAFALVDSIASATGVRLTLGGNRLDADGSYNLASGLPEVSASLELGDLEAFEPFVGVTLGGSIRGDIAVTPEGDDASANVALEAMNITAPFGNLASLTVSGSASTLMTAPRGSLSADLVTLNTTGVKIDSLSIFAEGDGQFVSLEAETSGNIADAAPLSLRIAGDAEPGESRVSLRSLDGELERYSIALEGPVLLAFNEDGLQLEPLVLRLGEGRLEAQVSQTAERIDARVAWSDLPLGFADAFGAPEVTGTARGNIELTGPLAEPMLTASLAIVDLRTALAIEPDAPPINAEVMVALSPSMLDASAQISMSEDTRIEANATLPVQFSMAPFAFALPEAATLDARVVGDLLLQDPLKFAGIVEHRFDGSLNLDYRAGGTVDTPDIRGVARIEDGRYENTVAGTVLDAINLQIDSNGSDLVAVLNAVDGTNGTLALNAEAALDPGRDFPFTMDGTLTDLTLTRRDDATVQLAGTLDAAGDMAAFTVNGDFLVGPANFVLAIPRGGRIPEVEYIEVRGGIAAMEEDEEEEVGIDTPMEITLNIATRFPNRIHIRGPGLDSEWSGELSVTGTAKEPSVRGELRVLRGTLDLLDNRFELRDSLIVLDGSVPPNPYLNVRGQTRAAEVTAFVVITGTPDALNLRLESDPPLPQDEVLSRVLFDRPLEEISPLQALQLARAAAQLSGSWRGGSILGAGGGLLPIDRLDIQQDFEGTGETAIGAGTYLGEDIYVEVRQRLQSGATAISIDVELRRNLSLQGEVGSDGRTGAGVVYKRDY